VVLSAEQIENLTESDSLIDPTTFSTRGLDACSYDVRIGKKGIRGGEGKVLDLAKEALEIGPGGYAAVISHEKLKVPDNVAVRINAKRSIAYLGVALLTGSQVDPGYEGHLLFGFYNASSKKVVLRPGRSICSLVFEALGGSVSRPKAPDPDLLHGDFPDQFINDMANMDVLSLQQLSEQVKKLDRISKDILDLRAKYDDVLEPIKDLTTNVERLSEDVGKLSETVGSLRDGLTDLERITTENARQVTQITTDVQSLTVNVRGLAADSGKLGDLAKEQGRELRGLSGKFGVFRLLVYIFWAILLLVLGGLFTHYIFPKIFGGS